MMFVSSSAAVRDVLFLYGLSDSSGGAVGSTQASAGGGVSLYNSSATFDNVTFRCEGLHCILQCELGEHTSLTLAHFF